jgi:(2R)-3-sulfolactate dehydrogenase (NADP+)
MAPWGAKTAILGTNPIAFAAPLPGRPPLVIDLATSAVARGRILAAREAGQPIPEGWALDADGHPTTDPAAALRGSMAPLGGPKGAAIALLVEVMAACLTGMSLGPEASSLLDAEGPPPDLGQSLVAVDVERLSGGAFGARIARLALFYAEAGARFPGERRLAARARAEREGLTVPAPLLGKIREIAGT